VGSKSQLKITAGPLSFIVCKSLFPGSRKTIKKKAPDTLTKRHFHHIPFEIVLTVDKN
jgi:hypothetical protein